MATSGRHMARFSARNCAIGPVRTVPIHPSSQRWHQQSMGIGLQPAEGECFLPTIEFLEAFFRIIKRCLCTNEITAIIRVSYSEYPGPSDLRRSPATSKAGARPWRRSGRTLKVGLIGR